MKWQPYRMLDKLASNIRGARVTMRPSARVVCYANTLAEEKSCADPFLLLQAGQSEEYMLNFCEDDSYLIQLP